MPHARKVGTAELQSRWEAPGRAHATHLVCAIGDPGEHLLAMASFFSDPWALAAVGIAVPAVLMGKFLVTRFFTLPHSEPEPSPKRAVPGEEDEVFVLYQGKQSIAGPSGSLSIFCLKVETFLRVAKIPFSVKGGE